MKYIRALLVLLTISVLCSCGKGADSLLPNSGGRPFEVLVVSDDKAAGMAVDSVLSQNVPALPQAEPEFDVSLTDSKGLNSITRMTRNIVVVTVNKELFTKASIRYDKNVWARRQIVVYISTPDATTLRRAFDKIGHKLVSLLVRSEINNTIRELAASHNVQADGLVKTMTGMKLYVPRDMQIAKRGRNFIWMSNSVSAENRSVCVYTYSGLDVSEARFRSMRDSVMRVNIPGERDGMYMTTAAFPLNQSEERVRKRNVKIFRGLWEVYGDAMGGPFVAHAVADSAHNRIIVAEAFVFAPGTKKRNKIRQTEASLYTLD